MAGPTSCTLTEFYLQTTQHSHILYLLLKHHTNGSLDRLIFSSFIRTH